MSTKKPRLPNANARNENACRPCLKPSILELVRPLADEYEKIGTQQREGVISVRQRNDARNDLMQQVSEIIKGQGLLLSRDQTRNILRNQTPTHRSIKAAETEARRKRMQKRSAKEAIDRAEEIFVRQQAFDLEMEVDCGLRAVYSAPEPSGGFCGGHDLGDEMAWLHEEFWRGDGDELPFLW
jgi:hypothetical protein